jgi:hypothetical protein
MNHPKLNKSSFNCPHCNVVAQQYWNNVTNLCNTYNMQNIMKQFKHSQCNNCNKYAMWVDEKIIYPKSILVDKPNPDMNQEIQDDYIEAANILNDSPRAAAAILRLALQKLCDQLGEKGKKLDDAIANLVKKGLNPEIQKCLDTIRVVGNNAVHPGKIDIKENSDLVILLFEYINYIAEQMITFPNKISESYNKIPDTQKRKEIN